MTLQDTDCGIGNEQANGPEMFARLPDDTFHIRRLRYITRYQYAAPALPLDQFLSLLGFARTASVIDGDIGAMAGQLYGNRAADAARAVRPANSVLDMFRRSVPG